MKLDGPVRGRSLMHSMRRLSDKEMLICRVLFRFRFNGSDALQAAVLAKM